MSTLLLAALILLATRVVLTRLPLPDARAEWEVGAAWVVLLLAFEFLAGHFLFHRPWATLLAEYDLTAGRIWILIPTVTFLAPWTWSQHP